MKNTHSQLLVIGNGPCGLSAAIHAAQTGLSVTLLSVLSESSKVIKPLQSLYPDISKLLKIIQTEDSLDKATCGRYLGVSINDQFTPLSSYPNSPDYGLHINRPIFDNDLLKKAKESGVKIIHNHARQLIIHNDRITGVILDSGEEINADYLLDASGLNRFLGRRLKLEEDIHSPEFIVTTGVSKDPTLDLNQNDFSYY